MQSSICRNQTLEIVYKRHLQTGPAVSLPKLESIKEGADTYSNRPPTENIQKGKQHQSMVRGEQHNPNLMLGHESVPPNEWIAEVNT
jgi:hypothetical protein